MVKEKREVIVMVVVMNVGGRIQPVGKRVRDYSLLLFYNIINCGAIAPPLLPQTHSTRSRCVLPHLLLPPSTVVHGLVNFNKL